MVLYAVEKVPVIVVSVSAIPKTGGCPESTVSVTTESVISTTGSSAQGMGCATVATASAGTAGTGTLVKSGWEKNTEANREQDTGFRELRPGCPV